MSPVTTFTRPRASPTKTVGDRGGVLLRNVYRFASVLMISAAAVVAVALCGVGPAAARQDAPTIAKDSVQLTAFTFSSFKGNYDVWSWVPLITFRVNGPIPSGSQLYVEYT